MKKLIACLLILILMVVFAVGCSLTLTETSREPIDCRYKKPYTSIESEMEYHFDVLHFEMAYVPITKSVDHAGRYEILYRITYKDGHQTEEWEEVDKQTYKQFRQEVTKQ